MNEDDKAKNPSNPTAEQKGTSSGKGASSTTPASAKLQQHNPVQSTPNSDKSDDQKRPPWYVVGLWHFITEQKHSNAVVAIFTLLLFLSTTIYAVFAALQWLTMRDTLAEMKIALHITERAYVVAEAPELHSATHTVTITFNNIGHIPSGRLEIITHEATINLESSGPRPDLSKAVEKHWGQTIVQALSPGPGLTVNVPVVLVSETKIQQGLQTIVIVGKFRYQDGFQDDGTQNALFCFQTLLLTEQQRVVWRERDPLAILPKMEALDGYPKNGEYDR